MTNLKNLSKRGLALFLALVMCLGMLNLTAFAAEDSGAAVYNCGMTEHTHTDACLKAEATPAQSVEGHQHDDNCYGDCVLEISEGHTHIEGECYKIVTVEGEELICSESTEGHSHTDDCYTVIDTKSELTCNLEETEGHSHSDDCYTTTEVTKYKTVTEEYEESYTEEYEETITVVDERDKDGNVVSSHTETETRTRPATRPATRKIQVEDGTEKVSDLTCGKTEIAAHTHDAVSCYTTVETKELICGKDEGEGAHVHDDETCYQPTTVTEKEYTCTLEETEGHNHSAGCMYKLICELEETEAAEVEVVAGCDLPEHTHTVSCCDAAVEFIDGADKVYADFKALDLTAGISQEQYASLQTEMERLQGLMSLVPDKLQEDDSFQAAWNKLAEVWQTLEGGIMILGTDTWDSVKQRLEEGTDVTLNGNIEGNTTINISGDVTLNLGGYEVKFTETTSTDANGSVFHVTAGTFTLEGTGTVTGGVGTLVKNSCNADPCTTPGHGWCEIIARDKSNGESAGGAVLVESGAVFTMNGGTIDNNSATWGGGIAVARGGFLNIYGGTISNNTATSAGNDTLSGAATGNYGGGGGIFCAGDGVINPTKSSISITDNETGTVNDLGGGGVFIESKGTMKIYNAIVTDNDADGQGGGVAGCLHGKVSNLSPQTAAIYGNRAAGTARVTRLSAIDHNNWWYGKAGVSAALDYFCAGYSVVGKVSMNGGDAKWTGWKATSATSGVSAASGDPVVVEGVTGLCVGEGNDVAAKANTFSGKTVDISGNTSSMHGGGIGCNGKLSFGEESFSYSTSTISINATKAVSPNALGADAAKDGYTFQLLKGTDVLATTTSGENGAIIFSNLSTSVLFGEDTIMGDVSVDLTLREVAGSKTGMTYVTADRVITINATRTEKTITISTGGNSLDVTTHKFTDSLDSATVKVDGVEVQNGASTSTSGDTVTLNGDANFTNTMEYGSLQVKKVVSELGETEKNFSFTVTLTAPDGETANWENITVEGATDARRNGGTITFKLKHNQVATISNIPVDAKYAVSEADDTNYNKSGEVSNGTIGAGDNGTVTVTNTRKLSNLTVKKSVVYDDASSQIPGSDDQFEIVVQVGNSTAPVLDNINWNKGDAKDWPEYYEDGQYTFIVKAGDFGATLRNIPNGISWKVISEKPLNDAAHYTRDRIEGEIGVFAGNATVTVHNNYFKSKTTSFSGEKQWEVEEVDALIPASINVQLYRSWDGGSEAVGDPITISSADGWNYNFGNLPEYKEPGVLYKYSVKETLVSYSADNTAIEAYLNQEAQTSGLKIDTTKPIVEETKDGHGTGYFKIYGTRGEVLGAFYVKYEGTDIINSWVPASHLGSASFQVKKVNAAGDTLDGATFVLTDTTGKEVGKRETGNGGIAVFSSLKSGTYKLTETVAPTGYVAGATAEWTVTVNEDSLEETVEVENPKSWENTWNWVASIDGMSDGVLTVTNDRIMGKISVTKQVEVAGSDTDEFDSDTYIFDVYAGTDTTAEAVDTLTVTNGRTETTKELEYGPYTIVERTPDAAHSDYRWDGVSFVLDGAASGSSIQVMVAENGVTYEVTATNHYTELGGLSLNKIVTGGDGNRTYDWKFILTLDGDTIREDNYTFTGEQSGDASLELNEDGTYTVTMKHGVTLQVTDLVAGTTYEITEVEANMYGYYTSASKDDTGIAYVDGELIVSGTIDKDTANSVVFTNNRPSDPDDPYTPPPTPEEPTPEEPPETPPDEPEIPDEPVPTEEIEINDENTPLSSMPSDEEEIPDEDVPLMDVSPETGDNSLTSLWASLCAFSLAGIASLLRKKKDEE